MCHTLPAAGRIWWSPAALWVPCESAELRGESGGEKHRSRESKHADARGAGGGGVCVPRAAAAHTGGAEGAEATRGRAAWGEHGSQAPRWSAFAIARWWHCSSTRSRRAGRGCGVGGEGDAHQRRPSAGCRTRATGGILQRFQSYSISHRKQSTLASWMYSYGALVVCDKVREKDEYAYKFLSTAGGPRAHWTVGAHRRARGVARERALVSNGIAQLGTYRGAQREDCCADYWGSLVQIQAGP